MSQTVLITGASGGIGKELAYLFAKDGNHLVLVARSSDKLRQLAEEITAKHGIQVKVIVKDLEDSKAPSQIYEELIQQGVQIDVLVNNAGYGLYGEFIKTDLQKELSMIDLNMRALTELTKLFLPGMVHRRQGGIFNVASAAAFQPGPLMAVYYATKAYVLSFTEALNNECKGTGVAVTVLCPGPTKTEFAERAILGESKLFQSGAMDVQDVAKIGYRGFLQGRALVIPGMKNSVLAFSVRLLPRKFVTQYVRNLQSLK